MIVQKKEELADESVVPAAILTMPTPFAMRPGSAGAVPAAFTKAVREALRFLHETRGLIRNPLLASNQVAARAGDGGALGARLEALRGLVCATVRSLDGRPRTEAMARALLHTYVDPAPTQQRAAERAAMPFGTYRRQLAAGIEEVAARLWVGEGGEVVIAAGEA